MFVFENRQTSRLDNLALIVARIESSGVTKFSFSLFTRRKKGKHLFDKSQQKLKIEGKKRKFVLFVERRNAFIYTKIQVAQTCNECLQMCIFMCALSTFIKQKYVFIYFSNNDPSSQQSTSQLIMLMLFFLQPRLLL